MNFPNPFSSVHQSQNTTVNSTQRYLKIAEIKDNTVVLKDGSIRAVLETSSINFNLKSEEEQNAIIYSYQNFVNTLEFPIEILIQSRKLDVDKYVDNLRRIAKNQPNYLLQRQTVEYAEYVQRLVEYADIMQKRFFVIVPYEKTLSKVQKNMFSQFWDNINPEDTVAKFKMRLKEFNVMKDGLAPRINAVKTGLEQMNLKVRQLTTRELIELYYESYNPLLSRYQKTDQLEQMRVGKQL